jgi:hypothetical protein
LKWQHPKKPQLQSKPLMARISAGGTSPLMKQSHASTGPGVVEVATVAVAVAEVAVVATVAVAVAAIEIGVVIATNASPVGNF